MSCATESTEKMSFSQRALWVQWLGKGALTQEVKVETGLEGTICAFHLLQFDIQIRKRIMRQFKMAKGVSATRRCIRLND
jgi:hypothetical protein